VRPLTLPRSSNTAPTRPRGRVRRCLSLAVCLTASTLTADIFTTTQATAQSPEPAPPFRSQAQISSAPLTTTPSASDVTTSIDAGEALNRRGSVVFRETPVSEVILILSEQWDVNIVAGAQIDGTVSGTFKNETLEKILDSLLTANGFSYRRIGNSLVVVADGQSSNSRPSFSVEVIDIPLGDTDQLEELIEALKLQMSPEGRLQPIKSSGKFAISDTPDRIAAVKELLRQIVTPSQQFVSTESNTTLPGTQSLPTQAAAGPATIELRPQFMTAKDLEQPLAMLLGEATTAIIESENIIVVYGSVEQQNKARSLLQQLDHPRAQVRITGYIYDVDLSEIERLGVDWNNQIMSRGLDPNGIPRNLGLAQSGLLVPGPPNNAAGVATGLANMAGAGADLAGGAAAGAAGGAAGGAAAGAAAASATGGQFLFRTLHSNVEVQAMIQALDQTEGSRLLADPHVTVLDRHTASLGIVTEIPIQQLTQTQQGGAIGTTTFREAGITLEVTPRISSDGTICVNI
jgi:general secretion pathway protein D